MAKESMEILVNGSKRRIPPGTPLSALIDELKLPWRFVAVERNRELVPRSQHSGCILQPGDELEIVTLVGGG